MTNTAAEVLISKSLDSSERINRLCVSEDVVLETSLKYRLQNISSDSSKKTLYLGCWLQKAVL